MAPQFIKRIAIVSLNIMLTGFLPRSAMALNVDIYNGHSDTGGGAPFSDLEGSSTTVDILFGTNTGFDWHPFGLSDFGAVITGLLNVPTDGNYTFSLLSDDGSLLFINNILAVDNGGNHGPTGVSNSVFLPAGSSPFRVEFFECCGGPSGVDLSLPPGVTYAAPNTVPESGTITLLGLGLVFLGIWYGRTRL